MHNALKHPELIAPTRALLKSAGVPYCIENCQFASNRDPLFASNRDPSGVKELGLST